MSTLEAFASVESRVLLLLRDNIDTDQIIPARFLKVIDKQGLGERLFYDWRYRAEGEPNPEFVLNQPGATQAAILVAGANFGCGSSREHAPWALLAFGIRVVVARSFGDIFRANALKNGLLPVELEAAAHGRLCELLAVHPELGVRIDLGDQSVSAADVRAEFRVEPFARRCLMEGMDELGYLLSFEQRISEFEARQRAGGSA